MPLPRGEPKAEARIPWSIMAAVRSATPSLNMIYVGNYWNTSKGQADKSFFDGAGKTVAGAYEPVLKQYGVQGGSFAGSTVVACSGKSISDAQIQALVSQQIAAGPSPRNPQAVYSVVLPPGVGLSDVPGALATTACSPARTGNRSTTR